ncbi:hypothetical protein BN946_scf184851.g22 [Trametes cinnabarina]|uniref:Cryptic loci regulator 2 N-terminal domain-containing protein n=1 Tax=Pycnoporus cinnabarinus TaxID=5643 RepID=A0A060SBG4_PYCCI|nr:hypothetical protein BN946_scf184851.g22 [Trametes cinnabarina]
MARRYAGAHTIPENPTWLEFPRSDGDPSVLPRNTKQVVDSEGQVNFMRPVPLDESLAIGWRVSVGAALAVRMGLPEGPKYVLKSFPEGYQLYDHNKGPVKAPRHDPYLCGSVNVNRFRSTNEFIPHALWLMQDPTLDRANCSCKYCTKQPQRIISDNLGLSGLARRSASASGALPPSLKAPRPRREPRESRQARAPPKPFAAVRRAPKPPKTLVGPQDHILPERDLDIRAALVLGENQRPRWFRKGEVVWCLLDPPIRGKRPEEDIHFWPGLVEDEHIKTQAVPEPSDSNGALDTDAEMSHLYEEAAAGSPAVGELSGGSSSAGPSRTFEPPLEAHATVPWKVKQWYVYKLKLVGTAQHCFVTDEQILPYLAHAPSDQLLDRVREELSDFLQTVPIDQMDRDLELMSTFDPLEPEPQGEDPGIFYEKYKRATAPYTLAIQIAANIAQYWLPTDEWECKFVLPSSVPGSSARSPHPQLSASQGPSPPSSQLPPPPAQNPAQAATLHSLITQSLSQNAHFPSTDGPSGVFSGRSESASIRLPRTSQFPKTVTQTRFQGLWWGTERIWTDELVRLKIARCQFAPKGTDVIYPPAGPSASTLEHVKGNPEAAQADPQRLGSSEKGLFMRIDGLFLVDTHGPDGPVRECRASGMVYELVDDDWEGTVEANKSIRLNGSIKGKEKATDVLNGMVIVCWRYMDVDDASIAAGPATPNRAASQDASGAPTFMSQPSQPSPLKPAPLPNPDPSVPVSEQANSVLSQTSPAAAKANDQNARTLGDQLSHPVLSLPYPLPPATKGFRFRAILPPEHEAVVSLSLISGRYYPGLFHHPLVAPTIANALSQSTEDDGLYRHRHLWAMEGLLPGIHQSMEPKHWRKSRMLMLQEADKEARDRFRERWEETKMARLHPPRADEELEQEQMQGQQSQWEQSNGHVPMEVD